MDPATLRRLIRLPGLCLVVLLTPPDAPAVIRDGGIDPANLGKGDWVYYLSALTSGLGGNVPSVTNIASFMAFEKSQGIRYIIVKAASGSTLYPSDSSPQFTTSLVNAAHTAGLWIFGYNRSGQGGVDVAGEVAVADFVFGKGADGFVWDAESEWEASNVPDNLNLAWQICSQTRSNWPNKFLAHAPFPIISYHSSFPYKEFGYWSDTIMPQIYHYGWTGVKRSPSGGINWSDVNWRNWQNSLVGQSAIKDGVRIYWTNSIKPLAPINHVYGPNPPNSGVSHIPDNNVLEFIDYLNADPHCVTPGGYKGVSFWRADLHGAAQWANIKAATIGDFPGIVNNIVIDNPDTTKVGSWTSTRTFYNGSFYGGTTDTNSFGTNYQTKSQGTGAAYVQFTPNIIVPGDYDVFQWHPLLTTASAGTPHVINYNGGSTTVYANQQTNSGKWSLLGRFNFSAGTSGNVQVTDAIPETNKVAIVDGLKLVYVPPPGATNPVASPSGLTATALSSSQIRLAWTDNATNEIHYVIARSTNSGGPYLDTAMVGANFTTYTNTGLAASITYYYVLRAVNVTFASSNSTQASATTQPIAPPPIANVSVLARPTSAQVTWTTASNATSQVEYGFTTNHGSLSPLDATLTTSHGVLLAGLSPETNYFFRVISSAGTNEWRSDEAGFSTAFDIIVDNPEASYSGDWTLGTSSPDKYGDYYQSTATTPDFFPSAGATYRPHIQLAAKYDVAVWYPAGFNRTANGQISLFFDGGSATARVNQTTNGGTWQLVAKGLDFAAGTEGFATIGNNTGESGKVLMADAMRWSYTPSQDNPPNGGVPDWWANFYFGSSVDASLDSDGDGFSSYAEYVLGTVPTNSSSRLEVRVEGNVPGFRVVFSPCLSGRVYQLAYTTNLGAGSWTLLPDAPTVNGSEGTIAITNPGAGSRFYRLAVHLSP